MSRPRHRSALVSRVVVGTVAAGALALGYALTASNAVTSSRAGQSSVASGPDELKPAECAGVALDNLVTGSGTLAVTGGDLVLGSAGDDTITVTAGDNCIVGGSGTDTVDAGGAGGTEICVISVGSSQTGCTTVVRRP